ncbi:protein kinase [bacterium]|nr:protein kinase [bacterium]
MSDVRSIFRSIGLSHWRIVNERIKPGGQAAVLMVANDVGEDGVFRCLIDPNTVAIERFHRELQLLTDPRFRHPNIVELLDYTSSPSQHWYISRFGHSFVAYWKSIRDANDEPEHLVREAVEIVAKLADGLGPLHREGVIHRDIKPRNIVMRTDISSEPVLIDSELLM